MKCLVLADAIDGKQFINIVNNHSVFQDTIARNIPYCDEFIIVTEYEKESLVEKQLEPFQGLRYRCVYEKNVMNHVVSMILTCLSLESSEYVLVVNADMLLSASEYKDAILEAKRTSYEGYISVLHKLGILLFQNSKFISKIDTALLEACNQLYKSRTVKGENTVYSNQLISSVDAYDSLIEKFDDIRNVEISFEYQHIDSLNDKEINDADNSRYLEEPMIKLSPALKDYLWGGNQLKDIYGIESDLGVVAEAWELSAHPDGESIVASGKYEGLTFSKYIEAVGKDCLGWKCTPLQSFPMLVKFIDAKGNLSVQVHPDDDYALENENQYGKNEMWYVVDSKPGSGLYVGFNRDVDREEVRRRVQDNTITEVLNFYPTKPGDIFFIPAGTVHAICEGNLICEIQQSSNCTYRLYDYDRRDKEGNPRVLHLEKALDVLNFNKYEAVKGNVSCKYFETEIVDVEIRSIMLNSDKFVSIICIDGEGQMSIGDYRLEIKAGESVFVPAQNDTLTITGKMKLAISHI